MGRWLLGSEGSTYFRAGKIFPWRGEDILIEGRMEKKVEYMG